MATRKQKKITKRIYFDGDVNSETKQRFIENLDGILKSVRNLRVLQVFIDCSGGSLCSAWAIYDRLIRIQQNGIEVETFVEGGAFSSAVIILLAGKKRYIVPHSQILIHMPKQIVVDELVDEKRAKELYDDLRKLKDDIAVLISKNTGQPKKKVLRDMMRETYLNAQEAVDYGLVHEII